MPTQLRDRREFLNTTGAAGLVAASRVLAPDRVLGANDRIRIGLIGCGGRGNALTDIVHRLSAEGTAEIVAVCDVWKKKLEDISDSVRSSRSLAGRR
jgi:hypothetical protein